MTAKAGGVATGGAAAPTTASPAISTAVDAGTITKKGNALSIAASQNKCNDAIRTRANPFSQFPIVPATDQPAFHHSPGILHCTPAAL